MNPRLINDLSKVVNGVSFVAKEAIKRSEIPNQGPTDILKSLVKTTAAICGLTRGNIHHFHEHHQHFTNPNLSTTNNAIVDSNGNNIISSDSKPNSSIVYFDNNADSSVSAASSSSIPPEISESHDAVLVSPNVDVTAAAEEVVISLAEANTRIEGGNRTGEVAAPLKRRKPRERKVPSTRFSRAFGFASLGAGLAWGAAQESAKRLIFGRNDSLDKHSSSSAFLSDKNAERLAFALCRMRGAALKIGQMLSIQDESLVPAPLLAALEIVRQGADVMPRSQINKVLDAELGLNWSSNLNSFNYEPMAAASIGQVHQAITRDGLHVAVKIQYPGVADSIESDIDNLKLLDDTLGLVPKGLYLDRVVEVAKEELSRECDYELEAMSQTLFRSLFADKEGFYVPLVVEELSSKRILTTELVSGIPIDKVAVLDQETRNHVGKKLLELTLMELFVFRFMQTDPNWSNYLYDEPTRIINLIDFGAARKFPKTFVDDYLRMVIACANCDRDAIIEMSLRLGFLSGMESDVMLDAHVQAGFVVGVPFSKAGGFDFRSTNITQSLSNLGATMLKHRLTPPPVEAYSLHRKLSGAFLACIKLGSVVPCRQLLYNVYEHYNFGEDNAPQISSTGAV